MHRALKDEGRSLFLHIILDAHPQRISWCSLPALLYLQTYPDRRCVFFEPSLYDTDQVDLRISSPRYPHPFFALSASPQNTNGGPWYRLVFGAHCSFR